METRWFHYLHSTHSRPEEWAELAIVAFCFAARQDGEFFLNRSSMTLPACRDISHIHMLLSMRLSSICKNACLDAILSLATAKVYGRHICRMRQEIACEGALLR